MGDEFLDEHEKILLQESLAPTTVPTLDQKVRAEIDRYLSLHLDESSYLLAESIRGVLDRHRQEEQHDRDLPGADHP
jgi:hypothetical protein